jgi:hypothetical protein
MHRKLTVILVAIVALVAFAGTMAIAADPPGEIVIDKVMKKKTAVKFNHAKHGETIDCLKCHHKAENKDVIKSCFECHGKDEAANDPTSSKKDNPFHIQCAGCHKEEGKGPAKCKECHPK